MTKAELIKALEDLPDDIDIYLRRKNMNESKIEWYPYPKEKPPKNKSMYMVSVKAGNKTFTGALKWLKRKFMFCDKFVTAWAEMPEPYKEET